MVERATEKEYERKKKIGSFTVSTVGTQFLFPFGLDVSTEDSEDFIFSLLTQTTMDVHYHMLSLWAADKTTFQI